MGAVEISFSSGTGLTPIVGAETMYENGQSQDAGTINVGPLSLDVEFKSDSAPNGSGVPEPSNLFLVWGVLPALVLLKRRLSA